MKKLLIFFIIMLSQTSFAATIHVPGDSPTIHGAIMMSSDGDTVLIADGVYVERSIHFSGRKILVKSENGPDSCIIDCQGTPLSPGYGLLFNDGEDSTTVVDGLTIMNGYQGEWGGGVKIISSSPKLKNCVIRDNYAHRDGGGMICVLGSYPILENCTFFRNSADNAACIYSWDSNPRLYSCILAFSEQGGAIWDIAALECCNIYGNVGGDYSYYIADQENVNGNFSKDPLFCDTSLVNLRLNYDSPCGSDSTGCGLVGALPLGCYGNLDYPLATYINFSPLFLDTVIQSLTPEFFWSYYDTSATNQIGYEIEVGVDDDWSSAELWSTGEIISSDTCMLYSGAPLMSNSTYYVRIRVTDGSVWGSWRTSRFYIHVPEIINVPTDSATIQAAINGASDGDTVLVYDGIYTGPGNYNLSFQGKKIVVKSVNGAEFTIVDCPDVGAFTFGFLFENDETNLSILDGFTIQNADFTFADGNGAGIYCESSSPYVKNCIIKDNKAGYGAGLYCWNDAEPTFDSCTFLNNQANINGGGVYSTESEPTFNYCLFVGNQAETWGGGFYSEDLIPSLVNCSFIRNHSNSRGSSIYGEPELTNCLIVYGTGAGAIYGYPELYNSNIYGNPGGDWTWNIIDQLGINNNFSDNPLLCDTASDNFHIAYNSPCSPLINEYGLVGALSFDCYSGHNFPVVLAIEYNPVLLDNYIGSLTPEISWSYYDTSGLIMTGFEIEIGTDNDWSTAEIWSSGLIATSDSSFSYNGPALIDKTEYYLRMRLTNGITTGDWAYSSFQTHVSRIITVPVEMPTIQNGIDLSIDGDTVLVSAGEYFEHINFDGKAIVVKGDEGRENTIISKVQDSIPIVSFDSGEDTLSVLTGFTIQNANFASGIMIADSSSATISDNIIQFNHNIVEFPKSIVYKAGGISFGAYTKIKGNLIQNNWGEGCCGGIACRDAIGVEISGNTFFNNFSEFHHSALLINSSAGLLFDHNIIFGHNGSHDGIVRINSNNGIIINNTMSYNSAYGNSSCAELFGSRMEISGNIVANNSNVYGIRHIQVGHPSIITNNNIYDNDLGSFYGDSILCENCISEDPLYCDPENFDFHIDHGSPCSPYMNPYGLIGALGVGCNDYLPRAVISIDRSGSMFYTNPLGLSRLERAKALAHDEIDQLLAMEDSTYAGLYHVAVQYFNATGIVLLQDFTDDATLLHDAIIAVPGPKHDTPLAAAMCQAHCMFSEENNLNKYIFTYTDGLENESQNFDMCDVCDPCNDLMETGWNFDCDPSNPASCTDWQMCLADQFASTGVNIVHYFGEPINPFDKSNDGLEDMYFLKSTAEESSGGFFYHSDQYTNGFICGDANRDFDVNVSDAVWILNYIFVGGEPPEPYHAGDANCDSTVNVSDAVWIINYVFIGGIEPCDTNGDTIPDC
jgi:Right handed beta helix region/Dockerin type I domain